MATKEQVFEALKGVNDPEIGKPITELDMVKNITVDGGAVHVEVYLTVPGCPLKDRIEREVTAAVQPLEGVSSVRVSLDVMSDEQRQAMVSNLRAGQQQDAERPIEFWQEGSKTRAIMIASGKGGVGKSSTTANLAVALAQQGFSVGVIDCDVYGYSIPRMLGAAGRPTAFNGMVLPLEAHGVKVISVGFFVPEEQPVIWRGPLLHRMIQQFLADVYWGDVDFVLLDLPPGTGDVAISIAQFLPGADMIVVTTPQEAAQRVAARAGKMTEQVNLRVMGVIENMASFVCPNCDEEHDIFGSGGGELLATELDTKVLGRIPIDVRLREGSDEGKPIVLTDPDSPAAAALIEIARAIGKEGPTLKGKRLPLFTAGPMGDTAHVH